MKYQVYVGNIGLVADTNELLDALKAFKDWVLMSKTSNGRAAGEPVYLMEDGDEFKTYEGTITSE
tara:strand:+ start:67 stop:261 length:195 start_codon:yes stop_codon:yes gene_type:complete